MASRAKTRLPISHAIDAAVRKVLMERLGCPTGSISSWEGQDSPYDLFHSTQVEGLKAEIVSAGERLWQREYVDGNGGNISARINEDLVLCTPTLCSKGQLREQDLSIVDLENRQIFGERPQTSEILLHLEIYKTLPQAKAVIHCHPPYATAHAVAGVIPQGNLIPEQEVFVGPVALAPYETPGTMEFAKTVVPFVRKHNTVLLANHGIVCWADTVAHAGWFVEVVETYCKTIMIASQLRVPLPEIPAQKILDLLEIKKRLGLPDARFTDANVDADHARTQKMIPRKPLPELEPVQQAPEIDIDNLTAELTARILSVLDERA
jgi:L-fuculose-phosphate aldolase